MITTKTTPKLLNKLTSGHNSCRWISRGFLSLAQAQPSLALQSDPYLVDERKAPSNFEGSAVVYSNVVSEAEEECILQDLRSKMKRRRFERGHWDAVIVQYKEIELFEDSGSLSQTTMDVLARLRSQLGLAHFANDNDVKKKLEWLPCHAIELNASGELKAHVDSVRFSGDLVAGLSLGSSGIMRLRPAPPEELDKSHQKQESIVPSDGSGRGHVDLLLKPRSLYALTGLSRYLYTHELLEDQAVFAPTGDVVSREDRFSVIFRDAKKG